MEKEVRDSELYGIIFPIPLQLTILGLDHDFGLFTGVDVFGLSSLLASANKHLCGESPDFGMWGKRRRWGKERNG
jgi:hypothetical protein